ncbi:adenylyl-sulfate kinase [Desulfovibrio sp.]
MDGWAVWITGLPGSGKSALARGLEDRLAGRGLDVVRLSMDERRKEWFPEPRYDEDERRRAYELLVGEAADLAARGTGVILDATAHRKAVRDLARARIPRFAEIHLQCGLDAAMRREAGRPQGQVMAGLYAKALERRRTGVQTPGLGQVIGVDVPFEADPSAECRIDNTDLAKTETLERATAFLDRWLGEGR